MQLSASRLFVQISDFGIVRDIGDGTGGAETFVGTFTYMSPERISGGSYSYAADIWSLGLTIMTCVFGKFPYSERSYWGLLNEIRDNHQTTRVRIVPKRATTKNAHQYTAAIFLG